MTGRTVVVLNDRCETVHVVEVDLFYLVLVVVHGVDTGCLLDVVLVYLLKKKPFKNILFYLQILASESLKTLQQDMLTK